MTTAADSVSALVLSRPARETATSRFSAEIDAYAPEAWDRLVAEFDDVTYEQSAAWVDGRWGARRSSALVLRDGDAAVAAARTILLDWPGLRRGVAYVKFGPLWRRRGATPEPDVYRAAVEALFREYCARRGYYLTIVPRPTPDHHAAECTLLSGLGFTIRRPMLDPNRYLVNVGLDPTVALQSLDQKWRYNLRQALRTGIECRVVEDASAIPTFTALHRRMVARKRFRDTDAVHVLPELAARLPAPMRPRVVLASHDGVSIAGAVVAACGDTAYYMYGATEDAALPLKAGYALHWWIVNWLPELGVRWYDLGGEAGEPGLRQFKKGLVGKHGAIVATPGELDRWSGVRARLAGDAIYAVRALQRRVRRLRHG
ncbi:MAG TPA: GNAT family N-acetyltransferase [Candidatus Binatia bacterium]|nr:GNAT family N-acetyltransferase [Candidatus Binatia bacterium]